MRRCGSKHWLNTGFRPAWLNAWPQMKVTLMEKKYLEIVANAHKRAAELGKAMQPLRKAYNEAQKAHQAPQIERAALQAKVNKFAAGEIDMADAEFIEADARIRLLTVRAKQAGEIFSRAQDALKLAERQARYEIEHLRAVALFEFDEEREQTRAELEKSMRGIVIPGE